MSEDKAQPKREQVLELLKEGGYTREEIAAKLGMSAGSVNSQFTYLRWMGNFIVYDENKKLSIVTEQEYNDWEAAKAANKKSPAAAKTPEETYNALQKSLATDQKNLAAWAVKFQTANEAWEQDTENEELTDNKTEAAAMVTLLNIKVKRAAAKFAALPVPEPKVVTPEEVVEPDANDGMDASDDIV